jgi:predicted 3-demethylubiquinone-9 3-methyltransferase (glyoxalase superfamily)
MNPILPCLAFADATTTEQAVRTYIGIFREVFGHAGELARSSFSQAEIDTVQRVHGLPSEQLPGPAGAVKTIRFHLNGLALLALNGGAYFGRFHETFSMYVNCQTQVQIDRLHARLTEAGQAGPCGWVRDRFGVSWQIVPAFVLSIDEGADPLAAQRMNVALLQMTRLDHDRLRRAAAAN